MYSTESKALKLAVTSHALDSQMCTSTIEYHHQKPDLTHFKHDTDFAHSILQSQTKWTLPGLVDMYITNSGLEIYL